MNCKYPRIMRVCCDLDTFPQRSQTAYTKFHGFSCTLCSRPLGSIAFPKQDFLEILIYVGWELPVAIIHSPASMDFCLHPLGWMCYDRVYTFHIFTFWSVLYMHKWIVFIATLHSPCPHPHIPLYPPLSSNQSLLLLPHWSPQSLWHDYDSNDIISRGQHPFPPSGFYTFSSSSSAVFLSLGVSVSDALLRTKDTAVT